jgi:hypothetical protein
MGSWGPISTWAHQEWALAETVAARLRTKAEAILETTWPECNKAIVNDKRAVVSKHEYSLKDDETES